MIPLPSSTFDVTVMFGVDDPRIDHRTQDSQNSGNSGHVGHDVAQRLPKSVVKCN